MKKTVKIAKIIHRTIETEGSLWGFKAGDIVTHNSEPQWINKCVTVEGFDFKAKILYGSIEGQEFCLWTNTDKGLIPVLRKKSK